MNTRYIPAFALCLTLLAPACGGKGGAETAGQTIKSAASSRMTTFQPGEGRRPPVWKGPNLLSGEIRSTDFNGSVTVVNFWATWCGPCRREQEALERLNKEYSSKGVRFVGVNIRDTRASARAYLEEFRVTYPSVENKDSSIAYKFRVLFVPSTYVLDPGGRIAARVTGPIVERDLAAVLDAELAR